MPKPPPHMPAVPVFTSLELVERLRDGPNQHECLSAADRIEALGKQVAGLESEARTRFLENVRLTEDVTKLAAFKEYVHSRLDDMGIPVNPGGPHTEAGCRVGDRLDLLQKVAADYAKMLAMGQRINERLDRANAPDAPGATLEARVAAFIANRHGHTHMPAAPAQPYPDFVQPEHLIAWLRQIGSKASANMVELLDGTRREAVDDRDRALKNNDVVRKNALGYMIAVLLAGGDVQLHPRFLDIAPLYKLISTEDPRDLTTHLTVAKI